MKTLVALVSLVCIYATCWNLTRSHGLEGVRHFVQRESLAATDGLETAGARLQSPAPFVVEMLGLQVIDGSTTADADRTYYLWCFGFVKPLPPAFGSMVEVCQDSWVRAKTLCRPQLDAI